MAREVALRIGCSLFGMVMVFGLQNLLHAKVVPALKVTAVSVRLALESPSPLKVAPKAAAAPIAPIAPIVPIKPKAAPPKTIKAEPQPVPAIEQITQTIESFEPPQIGAPLRMTEPDLPEPAGPPIQIAPTDAELAEAKNGLLLRVLIDSHKMVLQVKVVRGVGNPFLEDALAREMIGKPLGIGDTLEEGETAWVEILVALKGAGLVP